MGVRFQLIRWNLGAPLFVVAADWVLGPASDALRFATSAGSQYPTRCYSRFEYKWVFKTNSEGAMFDTTWQGLPAKTLEKK
jgi:hypothetical protein